MTILDNATSFIQSGIAVIPVHNRDKRPEFSLLPRDDEDKPTWEPYKTTLPNTEQIRNWFTRRINYGVVCGWQNLVVLDFDQIAEYNKWLLWATRRGGITRFVANNAFRVSTSRGVHVYVRLPHKEKNRKLPGIDIKGDGYVLGPGSIHPSGAVYTALRDVLSIPVVSALSDVLPATLLLAHTNTEQTVAASTVAATAWQPRTGATKPGTSLVQKILVSFRIEDFFGDLRPTGKNWFVTQCPLHDDHNPSLWINTEKQICGCYAGCNDKPMDAINLYARMHGLSNGDAVFALASKLS